MTAPTAPPRLRGRMGLGQLPMMRRDPLAAFEEVSRRCGPVGAFNLGPKQAVLVSGPEAARDVLVTRAADFDKGRMQRRALRPVLRDGLLISEGNLHVRQRRVIAPEFTPRRIAPFTSLMAQVAAAHVESWRDGQELDLLAAMGGLTRDLIGRLLWSSPLTEESALVTAITRVFEWEMRSMTAIVPTPLVIPTARNRILCRDLAMMRERLAAIIADRRASGEKPGDLLDMLLAVRYEDGSAMSEQLLLDEVGTLWGAAHETSADAQFWTAYLLARHPEVAVRVRQEADEVLGGRLPTAEDLPRLQYSLQVFKESLRMFPPAASMLREAITDTVIDGYLVRKGTVVFVSPYAMHRSPTLYPDPERFDPSRFTPEAERSRARYAFLPFGAGKHVCIGGQLALTEGQVFTSVLTARMSFELRDSRPVQPQLLINLRPMGRVTAIVRAREAAGAPGAFA